VSTLSEPRKPDCDVCEWATAYHYAHELNLCTADLELVNKVAQAERDRIITLITDAKAEELTPEEAIAKGWRFDEPTGMWWLPQNALIALIKGATD